MVKLRIRRNRRAEGGGRSGVGWGLGAHFSDGKL